MAYQNLSLTDFQTAKPHADARFNMLLDVLPSLGPKGPWLAGGSVRKYMNGLTNEADYDIFFASQQQCDDYCEDLLSVGATENSKNIFNRSFLLDGFLIQCIHHEFRNTLIQTMDRFDISICQFGFDGTKLVWSDQAKQDVDNLELHFLGTTDPVYNLNRAFKYAREGYKPADGEVKKILNRVANGRVSVKNGRKISGAGASSIDLVVDDTFMPLGGAAYIAPASGGGQGGSNGINAITMNKDGSLSMLVDQFKIIDPKDGVRNAVITTVKPSGNGPAISPLKGVSDGLHPQVTRSPVSQNGSGIFA